MGKKLLNLKATAATAATTPTTVVLYIEAVISNVYIFGRYHWLLFTTVMLLSSYWFIISASYLLSPVLLSSVSFLTGLV